MKKKEVSDKIMSNAGITLIALIITIIVLLILAGITISMVVGENGIIAKAMLAKEKTNEMQLSEEEKLEDLKKSLNGATRDDEIIALKERIGNLETKLNNMEIPTYKELGSATSTSLNNIVTLSDNLSNYKHVMIIYKGAGKTLFAGGAISIEMFKEGVEGYGTANNDYYGIAKYVSDTTCILRVGPEAGGTAFLYGIK